MQKMQKRLWMCYLGVLAAGIVAPLEAYSQAASGVVQDVRFEQTAEQTFLLSYALLGDAAKRYTVTPYFSVDGGERFFAMSRVRGDVGEGVKPGRNLVISWEVPTGFSEGLDLQLLTFELRLVEQEAKKRFWGSAWGLATMAGTLVAAAYVRDRLINRGPPPLARPPIRPTN